MHIADFRTEASPADSEIPGFFVGRPTEAAMAELRRHPRYNEAVRSSSLSLINQYRGNRALNLLANERSRFIIAILAIYLHYTHRSEDPLSGLTAARLTRLCEQVGLCSATRAVPTIALMRWGGYLEPVGGSGDRRVTLLRPTERMLALYRQRWRDHLEAAAMLLPDAREALRHFDHPAFFPAYATAFGGNFIHVLRFREFVPAVYFFSHFNGGPLILYHVLLADGPGGSIPPTGEVPISASALAKLFHVSRPHVTGILRKAEAAGLLAISGTKFDMRVRVLPRLAEDVQTYFPSVLLMHGALARHAAEAVQAAQA